MITQSCSDASFKPSLARNGSNTSPSILSVVVEVIFDSGLPKLISAIAPLGASYL